MPRTLPLGPSPRSATRPGAPSRRRARRFLPIRESLEDRALLSTFTVTNTGDLNPDGTTVVGSLRAAIEQVNADTANPGAVTIAFNIPGTGPHTIAPTAVLPTVTHPVVINGYSQPGSKPNDLAVGDDAVLQIELSGQQMPQTGITTAYGLFITAGSSTVRGLVINDFTAGTGIWMAFNGGNHVTGNFIGTDVTGTSIPSGPEFNLAGGTTYFNYGVHVSDGSSGNWIGTDGVGGVLTPAGERNVISGWFAGVVLRSTSNDVVAGNYLGTDLNGRNTTGDFTKLGNFEAIGTLQICDDTRIGTDGNGTVAQVQAERNVISGNYVGVALGGGLGGVAGTGCSLAGNSIGVDAWGGALGNAAGVFVGAGATNDRIGGASRNLANEMANNAYVGVVISNFGDTAGLYSTGIRVQGNSIHDNGGLFPGGAGLGLDLEAASVVPFVDYGHLNVINGQATPDGPGTGPNNLQHAPVLTAAQAGAVTSVSGTLGSNNSGPFALDFYASPKASPSGSGEGQRYLGSVTLSAAGSFTLDLPAATEPGEVITVTATDAGGDTSEFSNALTTGPAADADLQNVLTQNGGVVTLSATSNAAISTAVKGVNALASPSPGTTETVTLDLGGGTYTTDTRVSTQPGVTLVIANGTLVGGSPALVVDAGSVVLDHVTAANGTAAPTILVNGGRLSVRHSVIQESTGYDEPTIRVIGGTVDLGTVADPGGNVVNVNGAGEFVDNETGSRVAAVGTMFEVNGVSLAPSSLSGVVFADFNNDGQVDFGERGIAGVAITVTGTDFLGPLTLSQPTDGDGAYSFLNLLPGHYTITEAQPAGYTQGINSVGTGGGTVSGDQFMISLPVGLNAMNYNYGERPAATVPIQHGQTAGIGFWNNKNGQALINALNGGVGTQLGDWLATTFPHMFGALAGSSNLAGKNNAAVASLFQSRFVMKDQKLDAQVLATALAVYVTNATLNPTGAGTQYGFIVSGDGVGTATFNVGTNGAAFGVADNTVMTVMDLLLDADSQAVGGVLYNGNTARRTKATNVFGAINQAGGI